MDTRVIRIFNGVCIGLLLLGGLNLGLMGIFNWNLLDFLFGQHIEVVRVIYALVGVSFLYELARFQHMRDWVCTEDHRMSHV